MKKHVDARAALKIVRDHGVLLTIAGGQVLRFTPPLNVTEDEIEEAALKVGEALKKIAAAYPAPAEGAADGSKTG